MQAAPASVSIGRETFFLTAHLGNFPRRQYAATPPNSCSDTRSHCSTSPTRIRILTVYFRVCKRYHRPRNKLPNNPLELQNPLSNPLIRKTSFHPLRNPRSPLHRRRIANPRMGNPIQRRRRTPRSPNAENEGAISSGVERKPVTA